ncbi:MarR family winged helix-turn-helix transcriptional regulator [Actinoplanes sp. NPDC049265]|uniref:MarR family winged helix-turn-helix transcriptional regulator n=1 Tax=Actinoplanes sp. NPDC049265 TaxID=3363902 RepID=UPI0037125846
MAQEPEESTTAAPEPRWLSDEERKAWLATASIMISLPAALDSRLQRTAQLTLVEYMVLSVLSERADRTLRMNMIAAGVSSSLSRLSHVVTRLEKQGLLRRSRVPGSGRRTNATLTDAGYAKVVAAAPDHVAAVRDYFVDALEPTDVAVIQRLGRAVAERVNPAQPVIYGSWTDA